MIYKELLAEGRHKPWQEIREWKHHDGWYVDPSTGHDWARIEPEIFINPLVGIAPEVIIGPESLIDQGVIISRGVVIRSRVNIGSEAIIEEKAVINEGVRIGSAAHIGPQASIGSGANLGKWVSIGPGVIVGPKVFISPGVIISEGAVISESPICVTGLDFQVVIWNGWLQLGWELHSAAQWKEFTDDDLVQMENKTVSPGITLHFIRTYLDAFLQLEEPLGQNNLSKFRRERCTVNLDSIKSLSAEENDE